MCQGYSIQQAIYTVPTVGVCLTKGDISSLTQLHILA